MKQKDTSNLHSHIGFWLRIVSNNVSQAFAKKLKEVDISVAEWVVMREMYRSDDKTSPSNIAEITGMTRGAISKLIEKLLEKKLVTRKVVKADRRYQVIQLTKKGVAIVPKLAALADINDAEFFSDLSSKEKTEMVLLLKKIVQIKGFTKFPIE